MLDVTSLITKTDFDTNFKKISDKVTSNKSKHLLVENELKEMKSFDLILKAKIILKAMMEHKMHQYFKQCKSTLIYQM